MFNCVAYVQNAIFDNYFRSISIRKIACPEGAGHQHFTGNLYQEGQPGLEIILKCLARLRLVRKEDADSTGEGGKQPFATATDSEHALPQAVREASFCWQDVRVCRVISQRWESRKLSPALVRSYIIQSVNFTVLFQKCGQFWHNFLKLPETHSAFLVQWWNEENYTSCINQGRNQHSTVCVTYC